MPPIGVGIIGASPGASWSSISHIPAIAALSEYELRAVSTSRRSSADAAAAAFDTEGFDTPQALIDHPGVDLVVVAVKVPHHRKLIEAAFGAGKMVYSEWPLATSLAEAEHLADLAERSGTRTAIGLQARFSREIRYLRHLIEAGYIGDLLATTIVGSGISWGPEATQSSAYVFDARNGATPLSVVGMHALDGLASVLGELDWVSATSTVGRRTTRIAETGDDLEVTTHDQTAMMGTLASGAIVSSFLRGGLSLGDTTRWEINGTEGDLIVTSSSNLQVAELRLTGGRHSEGEAHPIEIPDDFAPPVEGVPSGPARNLAELYRSFARDINDGTHTVPGFDHAVARHRLLAAIQDASASGERADVRAFAVGR